MADKQINELPNGGELQSDDLLVMQRGGVAYNIEGMQFASLADLGTVEGRLGSLESDIYHLQDALDAKVSKASTVLSNVNLDTLYGDGKAGLYYINDGCTNTPADYSAMVIVTQATASYQLVWNRYNMYWRARQGGAWNTWKEVAINQDPTLLFTLANIATTVTSYSVNWKAYRYLIIQAGFYGNMRDSLLIPVSQFNQTTAQQRIQITIPQSGSGSSITWVTYEFYKNDDTHMYMIASEALTNFRVNIYGF